MISTKTADEILRVFMKHLSQEQIREIVKDLQQVKGNKSFTDSMKYLAQLTR